MMTRLCGMFVFVFAIGLLGIGWAHAAERHKPGIREAAKAEAGKQRLVLMPLRVGEADRGVQGAMETALAEGLENKYEVFSGERVRQKAKQISAHAAVKIDGTHAGCDETRCLQDIAQAFQAELVAVATVTKQDGGYFLALNIQNIFDEKAVYSRSLPCEGCSAFKVVDKLKELAGAPAVANTLAATEVTGTDPESITWAEAQKANTADDYRVYLEAYPKGKYVVFAKARIRKLEEAAEKQAWEAAQQENSEASFGRYLQAYPKGRFAAFATNRLQGLKLELAAKEEAEFWQGAEARNDEAAVKRYLDTYPTGRYVTAAHAKLKDIREQQSGNPYMVRIPGKNYEIGKYLVTQKQWRDVMGGNPSQFAECGDTCPVENVSWAEIEKFLARLNESAGLNDKT